MDRLSPQQGLGRSRWVVQQEEVTMAKTFDPPDQATMKMTWKSKGTPASGTLELLLTPKEAL